MEYIENLKESNEEEKAKSKKLLQHSKENKPKNQPNEMSTRKINTISNFAVLSTSLKEKDKEKIIKPKKNALGIEEEKNVNQIETKKENKTNYDRIKPNRVETDVYIDLGSEVNIISKNKAEELGLVVENCTPMKLRNIFGPITTISKKSSVILNYKKTMVIEDFLVCETQHEDIEILVGSSTINKIKNKRQETQKLKELYPKVFDEKPSEGYMGKYCEIHTKPDKKVNLKYKKKIPHNLLDGAKRAIEKMLTMNYIKP